MSQYPPPHAFSGITLKLARLASLRLINSLMKALSPPTFPGHEEKTRLAAILYRVLLTVVGTVLVYLCVRVLYFSSVGLDVLANLLLLGLLLLQLTILRRGWVTLASLTLTATAWIGLAIQSWFFGGVRDGSFAASIIVIVAATMLLGWRAGIAYLGLSILVGLGLATAEERGLIPFSPDTPYEIWLDQSLNFALATILLSIATTSLNNVLRRARYNEAELRETNRALEAIRRSLIHQVAERRRAEIALRQAHDELERRVQERTIELAAANQALRQEIMEREQAESALRGYAARLEQSNQALQKFANIASHDLQEPLRKIQAFGGRLQTKYAFVLDEQGIDYLARMQNAASRMQALINGLLAYSRVTTRAKPFEAVDLAEIVQGVILDLELQLEKVNGRVEISNLPTLEADPTQMRQLLQNLISNALKFHRSDEPPVVKITATCLPPHQAPQVPAGSKPAAWYQLTLTDNGIGFDQKYAEQIFQMFQRLHGLQEYEGTGIGLATCRRIVERHGGTITAHGCLGQGATFTITLPTSQQALPAA